ncbi:hypothetical protein PybrP1_007123 [[Pythium] brassicae (nom. inval.)]|nr:hypothetical protein PybrP1_007123 [[Pythium] brassicae (nom. inval.)]
MSAQQWEEFECIRSMFLGPDELEFDAELAQEHERAALLGGAPPRARMRYTIRYKDLRFGREVPALEVAYPPGYPQRDAVEFTVRCPFLSRPQTEALHTELLLLATGASGDVVVLQLYQLLFDVLSKVRDSHAGTTTPVLGRRAIYFHHIINPTKRRVVKDWASELQLGGFSKIGWPGIVVVEGREADVQEYVRRLQHLRWKQMTVRGEETESSGAAVDAMRRLPRGFQEFPESGMSALAAACRESGVEALFLTTMKIYGSRSETSAAAIDKQQNGPGSRGRRRDGTSSAGRKDARHSS